MQELTLYHHGKKYVSVKPNGHGRYHVPELDMELGLQDGWVRFWYKGQLLLLPADLLRELRETRRQLAEATRLAKREKRRADKLERRAEEERQGRLVAEQELARLREQLARLRAQPGEGPAS